MMTDCNNDATMSAVSKVRDDQDIELPPCSACNKCEWIIAGKCDGDDKYSTLKCNLCEKSPDGIFRTALLAVFSLCNKGAHNWGGVHEEFGSMPGRTCGTCDLYNIDPNDDYAEASDEPSTSSSEDKDADADQDQVDDDEDSVAEDEENRNCDVDGSRGKQSNSS